MTDPLTQIFLAPYYGARFLVRHREGIFARMEQIIDWADARAQRAIRKKLDHIRDGVFAAKATLARIDDDVFRPLESEFPDDPIVKSLRVWFEVVYEDLDGMRDETVIPPVLDKPEEAA